MTADEVAAIESGKGGELGDAIADKDGAETSTKNSLTSSRSSGNKRKAVALGDDKQTPSTKKIKHEPARRSTSAEESDEPEDDEEGEDDS